MFKEQCSRSNVQGTMFNEQCSRTRIKDQLLCRRNLHRNKDQGIRDKGQGPKDKDQGTRVKEQGTRVKEQGSRNKGQGTRDKDQGTRIKVNDQLLCCRSIYQKQSTLVEKLDPLPPPLRPGWIGGLDPARKIHPALCPPLPPGVGQS